MGRDNRYLRGHILRKHGERKSIPGIHDNLKYDIEDRQCAVKNLQRLLIGVCARDDIPFVSIDGIYGRKTREAVKRFQRRSNLPITGDTDYATWCALLREYKRAQHDECRYK